MNKPTGKDVIVYSAKHILDYIEEKYHYGHYEYVYHIVVNAMLAPVRGAIMLAKEDIPILEKTIIETDNQQIKTNLFIMRDYIIAIFDEFNIDNEVWISNDYSSKEEVS